MKRAQFEARRVWQKPEILIFKMEREKLLKIPIVLAGQLDADISDKIITLLS